MQSTADVNCDAGRQCGCGTFCCRLLVRLEPDEQEPGVNGLPPKQFVDKDPDGYCIHFDRESELCKNWANRPKVCREYTCNEDFLLQVAIRTEFKTLVDLVRSANNYYLPKESYIQVPNVGESIESEKK